MKKGGFQGVEREKDREGASKEDLVSRRKHERVSGHKSSYCVIALLFSLHFLRFSLTETTASIITTKNIALQWQLFLEMTTASINMNMKSVLCLQI